MDLWDMEQLKSWALLESLGGEAFRSKFKEAVEM